MSINFTGSLVLIIWNSELTEYIQLYRSNVRLDFQPAKGMKISSETNHFIIHDIEWDIEEGSFRIKLVQVEHRAGDTFIDMDYLIEEAERVGWQKAKGELGAIQKEPNEEFKDYCFPLKNISNFEEQENKDSNERFKEITLDSLTDLQASLDTLPTIGSKALIIGIILGAIVSSIAQYLF